MAAATTSGSSGNAIHFLSDFSKTCLVENFEARGWVKVDVPPNSDDDDADNYSDYTDSGCDVDDAEPEHAGHGSAPTTNNNAHGRHQPQPPQQSPLLPREIPRQLMGNWNFLWANKDTVRLVRESNFRLNEVQMINHFPNHYELTRKDTLMKNIKRYRRDLEKEGNPLAARGPDGSYLYLDIIPTSFVLPSEYSIWLEEFKKNPKQVWIVKPAAGARGNGIFLINNPKDLRAWAPPSKMKTGQSLLPNVPQTPAEKPESMVICRYIDNPLLIGGRKFDLRLYVLVRSWRPLLAFMYKEGFARFCTERYSSEMSNMYNSYMHLTNVSKQKHSKNYNAVHGGKWNVKNVFLYLASAVGKQAAQKCRDAIRQTIIYSMRAVQNIIVQDKHSFELYGYDILIDGNLKPWLIEVNASPSLTSTTTHDLRLKCKLIHDVLNIMLPNNAATDATLVNIPTKEQMGEFFVLLNEVTARPDTTTAAEKDHSSAHVRPASFTAEAANRLHNSQPRERGTRHWR
eukprot:TRINITY_DN3500_c0_g1_i1.p1 TRINITY_DN3500_c0_g1~~TRINITY_DN3500_c0_g1_i1.p1  ORF type:complete len:513 (-),score=130.26 TRINITY_DN3500_c0_g1_i1:117-1655(-)